MSEIMIAAVIIIIITVIILTNFINDIYFYVSEKKTRF
jgi:type II secretory pathway pseudopilin PulG